MFDLVFSFRASEKVLNSSVCRSAVGGSSLTLRQALSVYPCKEEMMSGADQEEAQGHPWSTWAEKLP